MVMPIFLDRHELAGMTAEDIAEAHRHDLAVQDKYGVKFLTYWFDQERGTGFCLIDAPDPETANKVHAEAHGGCADHVIPVDMAAVYAFLGRVADPQAPDRASPGPQDFDSAYRAVMFTDIVGSTEMTARLGDLRALELVRAHDAFVRTALAETEGREVKHLGDGIMAAFAEPARSLDCARRVRRQLTRFNETAEHPFEVRIGLHAGEPVVEGSDLFGSTVQMASRLCAAAEPGAILVSRELYQTVQPPDAVSIGAIALKGFAEAVPAFVLRESA